MKKIKQLLKVLVAEDEDTTSQLLSYYFEENNCQVDSVSNGLSALKLIEANDYDLVVLSMWMKDISSFNILRFYPSISKNPPTLVITRSNLTMLWDLAFSLGAAECCFKTEATKYISKILDKLQLENDRVIGFNDLSQCGEIA